MAVADLRSMAIWRWCSPTPSRTTSGGSTSITASCAPAIGRKRAGRQPQRLHPFRAEPEHWHRRRGRRWPGGDYRQHQLWQRQHSGLSRRRHADAGPRDVWRQSRRQQPRLEPGARLRGPRARSEPDRRLPAGRKSQFRLFAAHGGRRQRRWRLRDRHRLQLHRLRRSRLRKAVYPERRSHALGGRRL